MPLPCSSTSKRCTTRHGGTALCVTCTTCVSEAIYPSSSPAFFQIDTFGFGSALSFPFLSVTLFSLKINSVANSIPRGVTCSMYVDDLLVCYSSKSMATIERQLELCLNKVHEWSVANGFKFSKSKTICMHFCHLRTLHPDPSLTMDGNPIKVVKEMRFLGLVFDSKLPSCRI